MITVDTSAIEPFSFYKTYVFKNRKIEKDYLIEIKTADTNEKLASIFYRYSSTKHNLKSFDRIILETLFEDMLKNEYPTNE